MRRLDPIRELLLRAGAETTHQQLDFMVDGLMPLPGDPRRQTALRAVGGEHDVNLDRTQGQRDRWTRYLRDQPRLSPGTHDAMDDESLQNVAALEREAEGQLGDAWAGLADFLGRAAAQQPVMGPG